MHSVMSANISCADHDYEWYVLPIVNAFEAVATREIFQGSGESDILALGVLT